MIAKRKHPSPVRNIEIPEAAQKNPIWGELIHSSKKMDIGDLYKPLTWKEKLRAKRATRKANREFFEQQAQKLKKQPGISKVVRRSVHF